MVNLLFFLIFEIIYLNLKLFNLLMKIKGRVHQVVVTQLHPSTNSVKEEWCEPNGTKGKEIELDTLIKLNSSSFVRSVF
jgi:hypothetical protein